MTAEVDRLFFLGIDLSREQVWFFVSLTTHIFMSQLASTYGRFTPIVLRRVHGFIEVIHLKTGTILQKIPTYQNIMSTETNRLQSSFQDSSCTYFLTSLPLFQYLRRGMTPESIFRLLNFLAGEIWSQYARSDPDFHHLVHKVHLLNGRSLTCAGKTYDVFVFIHSSHSWWSCRSSQPFSMKHLFSSPFIWSTASES